MRTVTTVLIVLVAAIHVYIVVLEMVMWRTPRVMESFGTDQAFADRPAPLALEPGSEITVTLITFGSGREVCNLRFDVLRNCLGERFAAGGRELRRCFGNDRTNGFAGAIGGSVRCFANTHHCIDQLGSGTFGQPARCFLGTFDCRHQLGSGLATRPQTAFRIASEARKRGALLGDQRFGFDQAVEC